MTKIKTSHSRGKSLDEWLSYLESIHSVEIDLGLDRISRVANQLSIDLSFAKIITVAGTNGKGTTCAFLENALLASNETVAVYSSPHIERFNERLRLDKEELNDKALIKAFEAIELGRRDISLTYYEYTTLAAFLVLMTERPNYIILEVGLGGRLDATNMIDADIAVITAIDLDHQAYLGNTRALIGLEKAGIMRRDKPAIIGDSNIPHEVVEFGESLGALTQLRGSNFDIETFISDNGGAAYENWTWHSEQVVFSGLSSPNIPRDNVATAIAVLTSLQVDLSTGFLNDIIEKTAVPGRTEMFTKPHNVLLDVGHNPHAARYLASYLSEHSFDKVYAVVGMLKDKDIAGTLLSLENQVSEWFVGTLSVERAALSEEISSSLKTSIHPINCFDNVTQAFKMASKNISSNELVLVFGSFFTVAEIRKLLVEQAN